MSTRTITVYRCDRCEDEIHGEVYELEATEIVATGWTGGKHHLCTDCWEKFVGVFLGGEASV